MESEESPLSTPNLDRWRGQPKGFPQLPKPPTPSPQSQDVPEAFARFGGPGLFVHAMGQIVSGIPSKFLTWKWQRDDLKSDQDRPSTSA